MDDPADTPYPKWGPTRGRRAPDGGDLLSVPVADAALRQLLQDMEAPA
jgi:hypothetical protein